MVDFEKYSLIDKLIDKGAITYSVVMLNLDKQYLRDNISFIRIIGTFSTLADANRCSEWMDKNKPLKKGVYTVSESPFKKWKGE